MIGRQNQKNFKVLQKGKKVMKNVNPLNPVDRAYSANRNNTIDNGATTMVKRNNEQEEKTMTRENLETLGRMPTEEIIKMIEEKMDICLSDGIGTFIELIIEQSYTEKWLSIMDDPFILHVAMNEMRSFEEALDKWVAKFNPDEREKIGDWRYREPKVLEYRDMGNWISNDIREAIKPFCDRTKHGDITPFIGYCWSCWYEGKYAYIYEYEKIREFFEG